MKQKRNIIRMIRIRIPQYSTNLFFQLIHKIKQEIAFCNGISAFCLWVRISRRWIRPIVHRPEPWQPFIAFHNGLFHQLIIVSRCFSTLYPYQAVFPINVFADVYAPHSAVYIRGAGNSTVRIIGENIFKYGNLRRGGFIFAARAKQDCCEIRILLESVFIGIKVMLFPMISKQNSDLPGVSDIR